MGSDAWDDGGWWWWWSFEPLTLSELLEFFDPLITLSLLVFSIIVLFICFKLFSWSIRDRHLLKTNWKTSFDSVPKVLFIIATIALWPLPLSFFGIFGAHTSTVRSVSAGISGTIYLGLILFPIIRRFFK